MPFCPCSSVRSERNRAKVEVAGAIPAVDAILPLCLSSHRTSFVNSYSSVRVRPEAPIFGDHDVTAASRPVKAFVPVRIRLVTPIGRVQTLRWAEDDRLSSTIRRAYRPWRKPWRLWPHANASIPGMECLRSITLLVHRHLPKQQHSLRSAQNRIREVCTQVRASRTVP